MGFRKNQLSVGQRTGELSNRLAVAASGPLLMFCLVFPSQFRKLNKGYLY